MPRSSCSPILAMCVCLYVILTLWARLKWLNNYRMDCHENICGSAWNVLTAIWLISIKVSADVLMLMNSRKWPTVNCWSTLSFLDHHQKVKVITVSVKYISIYFMDCQVYSSLLVPLMVSTQHTYNYSLMFPLASSSGPHFLVWSFS